VIRCVNIALGILPPEACISCDRNADHVITVDELVMAANLSLTGCATPPDPTSTSTSTPTPAESPTPTPTVTATPALGPVITHFGIATADDVPLDPEGTDLLGRPIFQRMMGHAFWLIIEARRGPDQREVGSWAFEHDPDDPSVLPDLQVIVSADLGDGSAAVCDVTQPDIGGVPRMEPFAFAATQAFADAVNDLGCRVDDGQGNPRGRTRSDAACTKVLNSDATGYGFVADDTTIQFCVPIALAWSLQPGDTVIAARVRDVSGEIGEIREILVKVSD